MQWAIWTAAGLSFLWFGVHLIVGGQQIAGPFRRQAAQDHTIMAIMWMCWHMVTATLFVMGMLFVLDAVGDDAFVAAGILLATGVAIAGLASRHVLNTTFKVLPQGWLFVPVAALGGYAVLG